MRITHYICDRCKADFHPDDPERPREYKSEWPTQCKVEIPLRTVGLAFTATKDLCWPCRSALIDSIKQYLRIEQT